MGVRKVIFSSLFRAAMLAGSCYATNCYADSIDEIAIEESYTEEQPKTETKQNQQLPKAIESTTKIESSQQQTEIPATTNDEPEFGKNTKFGISFSPSTIHERKIRDKSPVMAIDYNDKLNLSQLLLGGSIDLTDGEIHLMIDDDFVYKDGTLDREFFISSGKKIIEQGDYFTSRNIGKAGFGYSFSNEFIAAVQAALLSEKDERNYEQDVKGFKNKIKTRNRLSLGGLALKTVYDHRKKDRILANSVFYLFFPDWDSSRAPRYNLEFEKKAPGDSSVERKRHVFPFIWEGNLELKKAMEGDIFTAAGIRIKGLYILEVTRGSHTNEIYMPLYEDYRDSSFETTLEGILDLWDKAELKLGTKTQRHRLTGTMETSNDDETIYYVGLEVGNL